MSELSQLDRIEALLVSIDKRMASGAAQAAAKQSSGGAVATDSDLDSQWGDEPIKKMPTAKYWQGDDFTGSTMSECPADFLDAFAKYKEACAYMGDKSAAAGDEKKAKYAGYDRKSAARARGWAKRIREGKVVQKTRDESWAPSNTPDDDIPF